MLHSPAGLVLNGEYHQPIATTPDSVARLYTKLISCIWSNVRSDIDHGGSSSVLTSPW